MILPLKSDLFGHILNKIIVMCFFFQTRTIFLKQDAVGAYI